MKIIYVTDLHGCEWKYERVLSIARQECAEAVVNGGDMYPKDIALERQDKFITDFLDRHFAAYEAAGIAYLCMPGNDDLAAFDLLLDAMCESHSHVLNIADRNVTVGGFEFLGFNLVVDYPFSLKDRCRMDTAQYEFQQQLGQAVVSQGTWPDFKGLTPIHDWFACARKIPTLEDELKQVDAPSEPSRTICVMHMPPSGLGLDVCHDGREVGSEAIRAFLLKIQPRFALHGHIHESPYVSGTWPATLGCTVLIQPGQTERLTYVALDLDLMTIERVVE